jgi:hypothetical protein
MANFYAFYPPNGSGGAAIQVVTGSGTAGVPAPGVVTVQGIVGGTPVPVSSTPPIGGATSYLKFLDYAGTPITTAAYVQLTAATASIINWLSIFDSSGSAMILAVGAPGSEVDQLYVPPGGSVGGYALAIPAASRISYKALDNNASSGNLIITGLV